ncbi:MAG: serine/threonine protein kinase [Bradymonadales bacterium]|nr:serine/threonine protein kinase [Bradymonadales bacterium]
MSSKRQRYELVSTLGRGGMAEVFLGWMNSVGGLRRKVAIKRILPELAQKQSQLFRTMFADEARIAFQLEHDNIVRVYDVGQSANTYFIVMEYVDGLDLKRIFDELTRRREQMSLADCVNIGLQACGGLYYAHSVTDDSGNPIKLVHNDISPPNIMVGRYGEVKITDFGLSDAVSHEAPTDDHTVKGKFAYISPEGTRDPKRVTHRSDIFSLGIVLWEILTGRRLFHRESDLETFYAVQAARVPDIRSQRPEVPVPLSEVVHKALHADPDLRYQSCDEIFGDLLRISYEFRLPINRFSLASLVRRLKGDSSPQEFSGQLMSSRQLGHILAELEAMLPPSAAEDLKGFVTSVKVQEDVDIIPPRSSYRDSWMGDVIEEAGLTEGTWPGTIKAINLEEANTVQAMEEAETIPEPVAGVTGRKSGIYGTPHIEGVPSELIKAVESARNPDQDLRQTYQVMSRELRRLRWFHIAIGTLVGLLAGSGMTFLITRLLGMI